MDKDDQLDLGSSTSVTFSGPKDEPEAIAALPAGTKIGRYITVERVGQGGMGVVYKAFDPDLSRLVALKLLAVKRSVSEDSKEFSISKARMLREAQALAQLSHPNVVTVHDVGAHADAVFMAMELVEGQDLRQVLEAGEKSRAELLEILIAAGRGLAAAHQAGIVHRDFKPANVILGVDGRVRVLDFGLARAGGADELEEPHEPAGVPLADLGGAVAKLDSSGSLLKSTLTQAGAIVGTPHYMAPEQHLGVAADEHSDQFSFCLVLFEALYGQRPFLARSQRELVQKMVDGEIQRPAKSDVSPWLYGILERGLRASPAERFPSMEALLQALGSDPAIGRARIRARRLRWAVGALLVLLSSLAAFGIWYGSTKGARLCKGGQERLAGIWDEATKGAVHAAFVKTGRSYAQDTSQRVKKILDAWVQAWLQQRIDACEATHLRGEQSEKLLDLRMECLNARLRKLAALADVFRREADEKVVDRAIVASLGLGGLEGCADVKELTAAVPLPEDAGTRTKVKEIRDQLNKAEALTRAGKYEEAHALARPLAEECQTIGYLPLLAETLLSLGKSLGGLGRYQESADALDGAVAAAAESRGTKLLTEALIAEVGVLGNDLARYDEALALRRPIEALLVFQGGDERLRASLLQNLAATHRVMGKYPEGRRYGQEALALREKLLGSDHPDVALSLNHLGNLCYFQGQYAEAKQYFLRALDIQERTLGSDHPAAALYHNALGNTLSALRDFEGALVYHQRALVIREKTLGPDHPDTAHSFNNLGIVYLELGRYEAAVRHFSRALAIWTTALGSDHPLLIFPSDGLGETYHRIHKYAEARTNFERALRICDAKPTERGPCAEARFGIAQILWKEGKDRKLAGQLARQAHGETPNPEVRVQFEDWMRKHAIRF